MLKLLLCAYGSLLSIAIYAQDSVNNWLKPSELVLEDPAQALVDFHPIFHSTLKRMVLTWQTRGGLPDFFCIERSDGSDKFQPVSIMTHLAGVKFQWVDEAPLKGKNSYRIKYAFGKEKARYSKTISYVIPGDTKFKFYPNPVDQLLIVRSEQAIDVRITDGTGKSRLAVPGVLGLRTINVSSLEKGVYILRFSNKLTNVISQEKLIKN